MQIDNFKIEDFPSLRNFVSDAKSRPLRICIATEEILGPVLNGGIASTYYHLARGLAAQGHSVTIILLKGPKVQQKTTEYWRAHYADFGIELQYLPWVEEDFVHVSHPWQGRFVSFYQQLLQQEPYDVIHTSEWRGGAYYALMAKKMGLAFANTIFVVKASSPHIWNRHYQMRPIDDPHLISASFAEQKCIEWADMVVGGSAHLLSFMQHIGYRLPQGKTYVQPNIVDFSEVKIPDNRTQRDFGDVVRTKELTFFGRLESRKGLEIFCQALDLILDRGIAPSHVTFLGKEGALQGDHGNTGAIEFIRTESERWPFDVEIITDKGRPEALTYLCDRDRIAIMPSLIENSTMAVYEALVHKIPFIATSVGGTPELIEDHNHRDVLVEPDASALSERMAGVLTDGQVIATPSFDNDCNLEEWYGFHRYVADKIETVGHMGTAKLLASGRPVEATTRPEFTLITFADEDTDVRGLLDTCRKNDPENIIICNRARARTEELEELAQNSPHDINIFDACALATGRALNQAVEASSTDACVVCQVNNISFREDFFDLFRQAISHNPDSIISSFFRYSLESGVGTGLLVTPLGGDVAYQMVENKTFGAEVVGFRKDLHETLGGFEEYDLSAGLAHEFVSRAITRGHDYLIIPEPVFKVVSESYPLATDNPTYNYIKAKSVIDEAPLHLKKLLLFAMDDITSLNMVDPIEREDGETVENG